MVGEKNLKKIADKVASLSKADEVEVLLMVSDNGLTRFANSRVHQNMAWADLGISVRVVFGKKMGEKRIGSAFTNSFELPALKDVVHRAEEIARLQKVDPFFVSLPEKTHVPQLPQEVYIDTPKDRAEVVSTIIACARSSKVIASGAMSSSISELAVFNSHGVWTYHTSSSSSIMTILFGADSTGYASQVGKRAKDIDSASVAENALQKVTLGAHPIEVDPGDYDVFLEPEAVNEMMVFFQIYAANARLYHEKASCLSDKIGKQVFGKNITIGDDPLHPDSFPMSFDFEGVGKRRMEIVKNGVLENVAYDSYYAHRYNAKNTGHALPAPNTLGPIPLHMYIAPGDKTREQMMKGIKKGLLLTRLWYVRVLNVKSLSLTGMTRDGFFLIENGKIVAGVKNMRFNQSIPDALNNVTAIENKLTPLASLESEMGINRMPSLVVQKWHFGSSTLF